MNWVLLNSAVRLNGLIAGPLKENMKCLSLLFLFGALSSTIGHIVQTASWTPEQAAHLPFFWFYRFFIQIRGREQSCRPGEKRRLQRSAGHLLLLWTEPLSARRVPPVQTIATGYDQPQLHNGETVWWEESGGNRWPSNWGGMCWGWVGSDHQGLGRRCRENKICWERMNSNNVHASDKLLKNACCHVAWVTCQ